MPNIKGNRVHTAPQAHDFLGGLCEDDVLGFSLLAIPALAQKGGRANKGGGTTGIARSDQVQSTNKKGDKDHDPTPSKGSKGKKTRTREGWEKNANHNGSSK